MKIFFSKLTSQNCDFDLILVVHNLEVIGIFWRQWSTVEILRWYQTGSLFRLMVPVTSIHVGEQKDCGLVFTIVCFFSHRFQHCSSGLATLNLVVCEISLSFRRLFSVSVSIDEKTCKWVLKHKKVLFGYCELLETLKGRSWVVGDWRKEQLLESSSKSSSASSTAFELYMYDKVSRIPFYVFILSCMSFDKELNKSY